MCFFTFSFQCDADLRALHSFPTRRSSDLVFILLVASFPLYKAVEGPRRANALTARDTALKTSGRQLWVAEDRKSTRLNSSHLGISYAVFCLKKKNKYKKMTRRKHQLHTAS